MVNDPETVRRMATDVEFQEQAKEVFLQTCEYRYSYNFSWLGRPIIQYPEDIVAMQELIWRVKPDLIVETGIAHGGSLVLWASLLQLIGAGGQVIGIDVEIRPANRDAIESHPLADAIRLIEGSSVDPEIVESVRRLAEGSKRVMVCLDSNHTHEHVLRELELYSPLVCRDSYLVVFDTIVEHLPKRLFPDRPWGQGNSPATAVQEFLAKNSRFEVDTAVDDKLLFSVAPQGYLRCVQD